MWTIEIEIELTQTEFRMLCSYLVLSILVTKTLTLIVKYDGGILQLAQISMYGADY